jgi:hypothetical protein
MRRAVVVLLVVAVSSLLTGCENFQEFTVQNPCDFEVKVAFDSGSNPPADQLWPFADAVPARGERRIVTGAPARIHTMAVQIRAPGRSPVVEVIRVSEDGQTWQIPDTFCRN